MQCYSDSTLTVWDGKVACFSESERFVVILPAHHEHAAARALREAGKNVPRRKMDTTRRDGVHGVNYRYYQRPCQVLAGNNGSECGEETSERANSGSEPIILMMNIRMYHFFLYPD